MNMKRRWDREREADDAPVWYGPEGAAAWAHGYNKAIEEIKTALRIHVVAIAPTHIHGIGPMDDDIARVEVLKLLED